MFLLEFEKPIDVLEKKLNSLKQESGEKSPELKDEIALLEERFERLIEETYNNLSRYDRYQICRHPKRPYTLDYCNELLTDIQFVHGDRLFSEDPSIVSGFGKIEGKTICFIGHQKGRGTKENLVRNFGMPRPEGYRKSQRIASLAERFNVPIITFIDTPGAYPGKGAEERGQASAIAESLQLFSEISVPILGIVIGEGGSGGALAISVANQILMLENSTLSVISPEGCASILWKDPAKSKESADQLKSTSKDLLELGIIDGVISEGKRAAHFSFELTAANIKNAILSFMDSYRDKTKEEVLEDRYQKFRKIGRYAQD